jgi:uncharacterized protein DUF6567
MNTIFRLHTALSNTEYRNIISRIAILLVILIPTGCNIHGISQTNLDIKTEFDLNSPNFSMETVNASGQASCFYILFSIPLCQDQNLATIAWEEMRQEAHLEGKSAQFVNVIEDRSLNWNFLYLFFQDNYSVSANTIVYK